MAEYRTGGEYLGNRYYKAEQNETWILSKKSEEVGWYIFEDCENNKNKTNSK